ncbi:hypothetical protein QBC42DRAFT_329279 [Cladorrhinum samala]|uniref:Uncharacterized protein n=1 Tax=Cladorrhinum samala TaxID=585594 RepID=A0AAV9I201_9PEZI|nr:hypothetical protein QBC42DRAFT_329279 [Cladorrhinum samala]
MSGPSTPDRAAAAELLVLSPMALSSGTALSSSKKRRITPTAEASSPKKMAIITMPGSVSPPSVNQRRPLDQGTLPNPLFQGTPAQGPQDLSSVRHIILPFDLQGEPGNALDTEKRNLILKIFPGTTGIGSDGFFLVLQLRTLPPKPWPLTIGGVPLHLTVEIASGTPVPQGRMVSWRNGVIAQDQNGRNMDDWKPLFNAIKDHFQGIGVSITEVMYWSSCVMIVLKHRNTDMGKIPSQAANIRCFYLFDDEMGRPPAPQARRLTDPTPGNPDNSQYNTLQPGLRVTSSHLPSDPDMFLSTTSGVLLKDKLGNQFMTVASHGFPPECGTSVFHAQPGNGRRIGELIMEVAHTDVALVKLQDTETFSNITFESDDVPITKHIQLTRFVPTKNRRRFELIYLDSPDTGLIEASLILSSYQAIPIDDNSPEQYWVLTNWYYNGQDSGVNLPEGMCGTAIWNKEGEVLGFFKYAPKDGVMKDWCAGIAADELINKGYTLVNTSRV